MIIIKSGEKQIYNPKNPNLELFNPKLVLEDNAAGQLSFKIYEKNNGNYAEIKKLFPVVSVLRDGKTIFKGRVISDKKDFYNGKTVEVEGKLAFLNDSMQEPFEFSGAPAELFKRIIENHNSQVLEWQRFKVGNVTVADNNDYIVRSSEYMMNTWEALKDKCFKSSIGGHIQIRYEEDGDYIDWLADYEKISSQSIAFAKNMIDISVEVNALDTYTAIRPIGATVDGKKIDISSVNYGKKYIVNEEMAEKYGIIYAPESESTWNDVTLPENLLKKAKEKLFGTFVKLNETYEINAVDLNLTDANIEALNICEYVNVKSTPHGISGNYLLNKAELFLAEPQESRFYLGATKKVLSDSMGSTTPAQVIIPKNVSEFENDSNYTNAEEVVQIVSEVIEKIPGGLDGASAYEIALENGFEGTEEEWLASLKGKDATADLSEIENKLNAQKMIVGGSVSMGLTNVEYTTQDVVGEEFILIEMLNTHGNLVSALKDLSSKIANMFSSLKNYFASKDGSNATGTWGIGISGNAATATKATQDGNGKTIADTYLPLSGGTLKGTLKTHNGITVNPPVGASGGHAQGIAYNNIDETCWGGMGALGDKGVFNKFFIGFGTSPWVDGSGLDIKSDSIKWKGKELSTSGHTHSLASCTGILTVAKGGTGKTTAQEACNTFINALSVGTDTPSDADYYVAQYANGGTTNTAFYRRPVSALWAYIKSKITGAISNIITSNLTASRALISDSSGKIGVSAVTSTELSYLDGVTSNIQTQLNGKAASSHGTHVSYSTTAPLAAGTASVGTASTVSRSDHVHPAQTSVSGNAGTATKWATARNINGMSVQGDANRINYGTCSTAAATAAKTVACTGFALITGAEITVKFTVTNTAANPTLNVNSTGAKAIYYRGSAITASYLAANRTYTFRYNGTQYELVGDINTNTDTKVNATLATTTKAYLLGTSTTPTSTAQAVTAVADTGVYLDTTAGRLVAAKFKGALVGNADSATKATKDGDGNVIVDTYAKASKLTEMETLKSTTEVANSLGGTCDLHAVYKKGNVANLNFRTHGLNTNTAYNAEFCTLPEGFRPTMKQMMFAQVWVNNSADSKSIRVSVNTNGKVLNAHGSISAVTQIAICGIFII